MAKQVGINYTCDRCARTWFAQSDEKVKPAQPAAVTLEFKGTQTGRKISYEVLCDVCEKAVASAVATIGKKIKGKSPDRVAKEEDVSTNERAGSSS